MVARAAAEAPEGGLFARLLAWRRLPLPIRGRLLPRASVLFGFGRARPPMLNPQKLPK
jgi:hypothetical protein